MNVICLAANLPETAVILVEAKIGDMDMGSSQLRDKSRIIAVNRSLWRLLDKGLMSTTFR
jgi:hypothetical protein